MHNVRDVLDEDTKIAFWTWYENNPINLEILSKKIGISEMTLRRYINMTHHPTISTLLKISKFVRDENRKTAVKRDELESWCSEKNGYGIPEIEKMIVEAMAKEMAKNDNTIATD